MMPNNVLPFPTPQRRFTGRSAAELQDQVALALAIADEGVLKSLLVHCLVAIAPAHCVGTVTATVGVVLPSHDMVDGILNFEFIQCVLAEAPPPSTPHPVAERHSYSFSASEPTLQQFTRRQSHLHTLGRNISLVQATTLLEHAGFEVDQIERVLHLPQEAWYKSWWYTLTETGEVGIPFQRFIRTRHYADGTYTLQYRDFFAEESPPCFKSKPDQALVMIHEPTQGFRHTLGVIHEAQQQLGITKVILICDALSGLEAEGFIRQDIHLYSAADLLIPVQANCAQCVTRNCPMCGRPDSPVRTCDRFCLEGTLE